jgi:hypothetical protein
MDARQKNAELPRKSWHRINHRMTHSLRSDAAEVAARQFHQALWRTSAPRRHLTAPACAADYFVITLMSTGRLVRQLGNVFIPLLGRQTSGSDANPVDRVLNVQVPQAGSAVVTAAGQCAPVWAERH